MRVIAASPSGAVELLAVKASSAIQGLLLKGDAADCLTNEPGGGNSPPPETTTLDDTSKFCMKFGHLIILRKIVKFVATRCYILRLKCTKFDFGWGCAPYPAGRAYSALPGPVAGLRGPTCKGRGREKGGIGNRKGGEKGGRGMPHLCRGDKSPSYHDPRWRSR